jgi:hypothetical protein
MLRRASVLLGLAVLLSLLFPLNALLAQGGIDPAAIPTQAVDLAAMCVALAVLPAFLLFRDARLAQRIPPWSGWVALLAASSVLFMLLHVGWSLDLATEYARQLAAEYAPGISHLFVLDLLELAARLAVLVSLVGVLMRLDAVPDEDAPVQRRKKP